jgi:hypothetical protein
MLARARNTKRTFDLRQSTHLCQLRPGNPKSVERWDKRLASTRLSNIPRNGQAAPLIALLLECLWSGNGLSRRYLASLLVPRRDDGGRTSVKSMKMMDRSMAVADAKLIGCRDCRADPDLGIANRGFHVLALRKPRRDGGRQ